MNKVIPFRSIKVIHEEASAWLVQLDSDPGPEVQLEFSQWLEEDERHLSTFVRIASAWDQMNILNELSEIFPLEAYTPVKKSTNKGMKYLLAGAMMICVSLISLAAYYGIFIKFSSKTYVTAVGEQRAIALPDGSEVILNTNSTMRLSYSMKERGIYLESGEGNFTVTKDSARPFRVYVDNRVIEAVGTVFNVQRGEGDSIEVVVTEGVVNLKSAVDVASSPAFSTAVTSTEKVEALVAGESAALSSGPSGDEIKKVQMKQSEIEARLAWREGMLLFQGESLDFVVREVSRYTQTKIEADQSIKDIAVHGYFRAGDINGLLITMLQNFKVDSRRVDDEHILLVKEAGADEN